MASEIKHPIEEHVIVSQTKTEPTSESRTVLALEGMTCASCAMRIEKGLKKVPGVKEASVNLATEQATGYYDPTQTDVETMVQKVDAIGYQATPLTVLAATPAQAQEQSEICVIFEVEGMTCASCAMSIEKGLKKVPGVEEARVNLASEQATVIYDPAQTGVEQLVQQVEAVGYKAIPQTGSPAEATKRTHAAPSAVPSVWHATGITSRCAAPTSTGGTGAQARPADPGNCAHSAGGHSEQFLHE